MHNYCNSQFSYTTRISKILKNVSFRYGKKICDSYSTNIIDATHDTGVIFRENARQSTNNFFQRIRENKKPTNELVFTKSIIYYIFKKFAQKNFTLVTNDGKINVECVT